MCGVRAGNVLRSCLCVGRKVRNTSRYVFCRNQLMGVVLHCSFLAKPVGLYLAVLEHFLKNFEIGEIVMLCYKKPYQKIFSCYREVENFSLSKISKVLFTFPATALCGRQ